MTGVPSARRPIDEMTEEPDDGLLDVRLEANEADEELNIDDEAAASLISYFCSILAKAEKQGKTPDYAEALHKAKRWVRSQARWKSPYYWGGFVLVGPN